MTCALIGLVIVLAPYIARSGDVRELMGQVAAVGWFALVLGGAFIVQYVVRRVRARHTASERGLPCPPWPHPRSGRAQRTRHVCRAAGPRTAQGLALRPPPAEPTTCCGRGCNGCVWEGFADAAEYWRQEALLVLGYE